MMMTTKVESEPLGGEEDIHKQSLFPFFCYLNNKNESRHSRARKREKHAYPLGWLGWFMLSLMMEYISIAFFPHFSSWFIYDFFSFVCKRSWSWWLSLRNRWITFDIFVFSVSIGYTESVSYPSRHNMSAEEDYDAMYNNCVDYEPEQVGLSLHHQRHQQQPPIAGQRNSTGQQQQHNRRNKAQHVIVFCCDLFVFLIVSLTVFKIVGKTQQQTTIRVFPLRKRMRHAFSHSVVSLRKKRNASVDCWMLWPCMNLSNGARKPLGNYRLSSCARDLRAPSSYNAKAKKKQKGTYRPKCVQQQQQQQQKAPKTGGKGLNSYFHSVRWDEYERERQRERERDAFMVIRPMTL